ncbi:MAG: cytochrome ubiquinol oxidase subunit I [Odoribacteraceae bacterium]|jgi:cytochrome d ubiquinol oxidase subunit I|nr:cytochrome ubiquinol oxidase subunit I [Odoribacteraceae bacterium]
MFHDLSATVDWSRWQFAMTAIYHYMFVPLTLGLSLLVAVMETIWYKTGNEGWLKATKFWMKLFGVNFAIGVATGLILEFQFGTNWSNYSWFVGDIFGAPLAIEGIVAFFMEATFVAVMFFGWRRVSKRFHLVSTWLVYVGTNISALWILVANGWMQNPVGMTFDPDTARNVMTSFTDVLSDTSFNKFFHTVTSAYTLSACFVVGVCGWFFAKRRDVEFARKSILLGSVFGLASIALTILTGDTTSRDIARVQPVKFAAMEGLNRGSEGAGLTVFGILKDDPSLPHERLKGMTGAIAIPGLLSWMSFGDSRAFVPGFQDILDGYTAHDGTVHASVQQRIENGRRAMDALKAYKHAKKAGDEETAAVALSVLRANYADFGYGSLSSPGDVIPHVPLVFYSFRIMVGIGFLFIALFVLSWWYARRGRYDKFRFIPYFALACIPLAYVASQCGWIVAEVGRQPWVVQDLMTTGMAATDVAATWVQVTFWLFAALFTVMLVAELKILCAQIRKGPESVNS